MIEGVRTHAHLPLQTYPINIQKPPQAQKHSQLSKQYNKKRQK